MCRALGISRRTLVSRLDAYGIPRPRKGRPALRMEPAGRAAEVGAVLAANREALELPASVSLAVTRQSGPSPGSGPGGWLCRYAV